ncbi:MAG: WD40 repeat domain-containing protein [Saprospiraceae bacterium]|nr:WD40 repeat domain-containing protein [Pyrinomonadaceae bacterium]
MAVGTILSSDRRFLVTTPRKNKTVLFQIWETDTGRIVASIPRAKTQSALISIKWSPNSEMIATSEGLKKEVKVWNIKGEHVQNLSNSTMPMQFSDDGKYLATGGVLVNSKVDTGYLWEFSNNPIEERLGMVGE